MTQFVLDASFSVSWIVEAERTPTTEKYLRFLRDGECEALVPAIWADEVSNVLLGLERSKKISHELAAAWIDGLLSLPIRIGLPSLSEPFRDVRRLAKAHKLTIYDARYLHLAIVSKASLATFDKQLLAAAPKVGVKLVR